MFRMTASLGSTSFLHLGRVYAFPDERPMNQGDMGRALLAERLVSVRFRAQRQGGVQYCVRRALIRRAAVDFERNEDGPARLFIAARSRRRFTPAIPDV
jgi:hypothetical protein